MIPADARRRFAAARVARLATASAAGQPHLVPITFALLDDDTLVTAVDHKPKRTIALRRLDNIAANPAVSVLVDHYAEDWSQLWWARADGRGRVLYEGDDPQTRSAAARALTVRYGPYRDHPPAGPVIVIAIERWSHWSAAELPDDQGSSQR